MNNLEKLILYGINQVTAPLIDTRGYTHRLAQINEDAEKDLRDLIAQTGINNLSELTKQRVRFEGMKYGCDKLVAIQKKQDWLFVFGYGDLGETISYELGELTLEHKIQVIDLIQNL